MIQYWKKIDTRLQSVEDAEKHVWIDARNPTREELGYLEREFGILPDHLQDIMDIDEQARIEKEDDYTIIIVRVPVLDERFEVPYFTVPVGIILLSDRIVTVCQTDCEVLSDMAANRIRDLSIQNRSGFVLNLLGRASLVFLRFLKDLNRRTAVTERELQKSIRNTELMQLLSIEKSLIYFKTALKTNEYLLEKFQTTRFIRFKEDETELLEDVITDNKQAIEMANIYSDILWGLMDAFSSVISNNLNQVMKRLTIISIVLMIPTLITSMFGMNVDLPFQTEPWAFAFVIGVCFATAVMSALLLWDRKRKAKRIRPRTAAVGAVLPPHAGGK